MREWALFSWGLHDAGFFQKYFWKEDLLLARKLKPFVITLDIMLPGVSGSDALKNLKEDSVTAGIPILVISMDDGRSCSILRGAFDHLTKQNRM